jgi:hypothetical protein
MGQIPGPRTPGTDAMSRALASDPKLLERFDQEFASRDGLADGALTALGELPEDARSVVSSSAEELYDDTAVLTVGADGSVRLSEAKDTTDDGGMIGPDELRTSVGTVSVSGLVMPVETDTGVGDEMLTSLWDRWCRSGDEIDFMRFWQGLDIMDLDPMVYDTLTRSRTSMGYWLPRLAEADRLAGMPLALPRTVVARVPMPLLQLPRMGFDTLNEPTRAVLDEWASRVFDLDDAVGDRFVKTGTFSLKFDARACHVRHEDLNQVGERLAFIQSYACSLAGPLTSPSVVGMSTCADWVCREWIEPDPGTPTIYHGLPLRPEFRVFVDVSAGRVLGVHEYWDAGVMRPRFLEERDLSDLHDQVTFAAAEPSLHADYLSHRDEVSDRVSSLLPGLHLDGQWSLDVMLSGGVLYAIDMAPAPLSTYYRQTVPEPLRVTFHERWLEGMPDDAVSGA